MRIVTTIAASFLNRSMLVWMRLEFTPNITDIALAADMSLFVVVTVEAEQIGAIAEMFLKARTVSIVTVEATISKPGCAMANRRIGKFFLHLLVTTQTKLHWIFL